MQQKLSAAKLTIKKIKKFFNKTQKEPSHIRFGFGSLNEYEITQSIDKLFQTLSDVEP